LVTTREYVLPFQVAVQIDLTPVGGLLLTPHSYSST
jgi:hypothetical protein